MNQPLTKIEVDQMLSRANKYEVNPFFFGLGIVGWMWAAIMFLAWVMK